jgi:RNase P subunit RPR2
MGKVTAEDDKSLYCDECLEDLIHVGDGYRFTESRYAIIICKKCLTEALSLLGDLSYGKS